MSGRKCSILLFLLLILHILLHLYSTKGGNFYFTVDQGRDALFVRDILINKSFILEGPRTGAIENLYIGPYWYYLISFGFLFFNGNPWGAVCLLIFLNTSVLLLVAGFFRNILGFPKTLFLVFGLLIFERFWFSSQYALNPNILPVLSIGLTISIINSLKGKKVWSILVPLFSGMFIHSELAFVPVVLITYIIYLFILKKTKKVSNKSLFFNLLIFSLFLIPHLISELQVGFLQTNSIIRSIKETQGVLAGVRFQDRLFLISGKFLEEFSKITVPQSNKLGSLFFAIIIIFLIYKIIKKELNKTVSSFLIITIFMTLVSLIWFSTNKEFLPWHILGLYPLMFIAIVAGLLSIKSVYSFTAVILILILQTAYFVKTYPIQVKLDSDQGKFANQLSSIDWIYSQGNDQGFTVYSYLQFVYDYPYQYTIWWRGLHKYTYLPCEYSTYPNTPSSLYHATIADYQKPQRSCTNKRFLIIEPTKDESGYKIWYQGVTKKTSLIKQASFGNIKVEERLVK